MATDLQIKKLKNYFKEMPIDETLSGLKFAKNRWVAKDAGILKVGRKSILKKEVHAVLEGETKTNIPEPPSSNTILKEKEFMI